ncbi:MAG: L-rhamnose isomerase [Chthonomonas sp.]
MSAFTLAKQRFADWGVDVDQALTVAQRTPVSLHCWQGDDVGGFENPTGTLGGGLQATGNYPGKARTPDELRSDLEQAIRAIPGACRLNLHAIYAETTRPVPRDELAFEHFAGWVEWCADQGLGFDFNPTCFSHPLAEDGLTLCHPDPVVRAFWVRHCQACRRIGGEAGRRLESPSVVNVWIPDASKDTPVDRKGPRERLLAALDEVFAEPVAHAVDAVESKLFGIGAESYTVGSHEFYLGYAATRKTVLCLDAGHFHPTESVADKISAVMAFVPGILLHVSRGVRWDSDHVVIADDPTRAIFEEVVRGGYLPRVAIGLDYFDASINRVAAWVIGTRAAKKCLLSALLEPTAKLREAEASGDFTARLALMEEAKNLPFGAVWEEFCSRSGVAPGPAWLDDVRRYERDVLSQR